MSLTKDEMTIAAQILRLAANEFQNHGCNDLAMTDTPQNRKFICDVYGAQGFTNEDIFISRAGEKDQTIFVEDWMVMEYLAVRLEHEAELFNKTPNKQAGQSNEQ